MRSSGERQDRPGAPARTTAVRAYTSRDMRAHMYVIISENGRALVVDPSREEAAFRLISSAARTVDKIILTHEHCDHTCGAERLRGIYGCPILCSRACAVNLADTRMNHSHYYSALSAVQTRLSGPCAPMDPFTLAADETFEGRLEFVWQGRRAALQELPGHSAGSIALVLDERYLFSGDTLLWGEKTVTRFPGGSKERLIGATIPWLRSQKPDLTVYPGHLEPFILGDRLKTEII